MEDSAKTIFPLLGTEQHLVFFWASLSFRFCIDLRLPHVNMREPVGGAKQAAMSK